MEELAEQQLLDPVRLLQNEDVSAFLLQAIQIVSRSNGSEKLKALREAALRGTVASNDIERAPGYVVLGIIDRMTDYHIIRLRWEVGPTPSRTQGEIIGGKFDSLHFGQTTYGDPSELKSPKTIFQAGGVTRYVESQSALNFKLAHADLVAMGLLQPILKPEIQTDGWQRNVRLTPEIKGYRPSELGKFVISYIEDVSDSSIDAKTHISI